MVAWGDWFARAERWLLPAQCLACQAPIGDPADPLVCALCRARWKSVVPPLCDRCGEPRPLGLACRLCAEWPAGFGPVRSSVRLESGARRIVHRFKYGGWWRLADLMAARMAPLLAEAGDVDLVPVPLSAARERERGYNQAERLAEALGRRTGLRVAARRLRRTRATPTQTRLGAEGRRANLAGAFEAAPNGRRAWLVDDVFTTGATLTSAASALLEGGAPEVGAITFARAELALADAAMHWGPFTRPIGDEEHG